MIKKEDLIDRGVYEIKSRNLELGVWNPNNEGFLGVREKWGIEYLSTEYLSRECGGTKLGIDTATPLRFLEILPDQCRINANCEILKNYLIDLERLDHVKKQT